MSKLICERCDNSGEVEISFMGEYREIDCCCVPFRNCIRELETEAADMDRIHAATQYELSQAIERIRELEAEKAELLKYSPSAELFERLKAAKAEVAQLRAANEEEQSHE